MIILDKMEAALRFYADASTYEYEYQDTTCGCCGPIPTKAPAIDEDQGKMANNILNEYEAVKGQIAVVPVQTSEARKEALDDFWHITDTGTMEHFVHTHALTIEAALQQPDTSEAVRVLVKALRGVAKYEKQLSHLGYGAEAVDARQALEDPAVIAAMKGGSHA